MAFQFGQDTEDEVLSDINVTPLVDVMLVLLIIFMVTTPMLHQGIEVALPRVESTALPLRDEDPMVLTVTKDEIVYIKDTPVHPSQLEEQLLPLMESRQYQTVFVKADREVSYAAVLRVIEILNSAGIHQVGLVTEPPRSRQR